MTEAAQPGAATAAPQSLTVAQAAQAFAEKRASTQAAQNQPNTSEAARILGQQAAKAREERRAEAVRKAQEAETPAVDAEVDAGERVEDDQSQVGEAQNDETASADTPEVIEADEQGDPSDGMIDLGDGVSMTKDEVRESILLKADHTKRVMALAEERKSFEAIRTQKLTHFDQLITAAQATLGQPKSMKQWLAEDPVDGMMKFAEQQEQFERFGQLIQARQQEQANHIGSLKQATIKELATTHGDKAEEHFSKAVQYVASKTGTDAQSVEAMLSHPEAVALVLDGIAHRELKASGKQVIRTVAEKPKVTRPGAKVSVQAGVQSAVKAAEAKARKSGSFADALALLRASRAANQRNN